MIHVCSLARLHDTVRETGARHVVTLIKDISLVHRPATIPAENHLLLDMDDITDPIDGYVAPADALAFVTSNPAKQLGIADRVGSLEAGKDGDFVVWSGDPLSTSTVALETWIDGKKYFDRAADLAARPEREAERAALVAKAKARAEAGKDDEKPAEAGKPGVAR